MKVNQTPPWPSFKSFMMGGFEGATHRRRDRTQIDVAAASNHDRHADLDYRLLGAAGIHTIRDSLRWHAIERRPGAYDWTTFIQSMEAASSGGTQVIWDLCHWGYPSDIDIFSDTFVWRFRDFAAAADLVLQEHKRRSADRSPCFYCPINEISFWAWVGGDEEHFDPFQAERGPELKRQLVKASIAATHAIRAQNPAARFIQAEPIIHISPEDEEDVAAAARHTESQFEAWDMLAGVSDEDLGGRSDTLDILGVNYYWNNQWIHEGDRTPPGHDQHLALHRMLQNLWERYRRPILITETGAECGSEFGWLGYVASEVRQAHRLGVPVLGICLYPVMDYPGWDDDRHCECGLIQVDPAWSKRSLRSDYCDEVSIQGGILQSSLSTISNLNKSITALPWQKTVSASETPHDVLFAS